MSGLKTVENDASVDDFLAAVSPAVRREDAHIICAMMKQITACEPRMWGTSIVGFDRYEYKQKNGTAGRWPITAFSPRKSQMSIYIMPGFSAYGDLMARLGKFKTGVGCLYLTRLTNIDIDVLAALVEQSVTDMRKKYR